ncbi:MAG: ATP-binding cassette domain-containing protein, partial [Candidatus Helarchaeota archaeon]|nr:ATP-binding cassette domain-containing protein [Candidatus Helarchaeota archaeon]
TTLIKMLCTLLAPSKGTALVGGHDVIKEPIKVKRIIGYVPQDITVDGFLTGRENLELQAALYNIKGKEKERRISEVLKLVQLQERADGIVNYFSGGMRRRLEIARGLMVEPQLLFLDEPTLGLDPGSRKAIWNHVEKLRRKQKLAILMSTHYMEEADKLCDRIAIIDRGRFIALDTPINLKKQIGGTIIEIELSKSINRMQKLLSQGNNYIDKINKINDTTLQIEVKDSDTALPKIFKVAADADIDINQVRIRQPTLEDVFLHYTGKTLRDEDLNDPFSFIKSQISKRLRSF